MEFPINEPAHSQSAEAIDPRPCVSALSIDPENSRIVRLFNPRQDHWHEHFQFQDGRIIPLTAIGRVTVRLLQFNRPEAVMSRQSSTT